MENEMCLRSGELLGKVSAPIFRGGGNGVKGVRVGCMHASPVKDCKKDHDDEQAALRRGRQGSVAPQGQFTRKEVIQHAR